MDNKDHRITTAYDFALHLLKKTIEIKASYAAL